jgi:broad specificity phosphatase PhoE
MTYNEIKIKFPEEHKLRAENKLIYRYPMGESYIDLIERIEPVIFEIERSRIPIIVVINFMKIAHQAVLRCLYAYFKTNKVDEIPYIDIPLHTII